MSDLQNGFTLFPNVQNRIQQVPVAKRIYTKSYKCNGWMGKVGVDAKNKVSVDFCFY